ncbi:MAG: hypothetical protein LE180_05845 [Endomicrobium sp.]|uniref:hypothetical protein n=1 Tax=Candidatus Endomicrobiellum pyrsonymphae TaxID=1408203 RepID=UPI0035808B16|nr:hypothetical protein [Endomicrobium sp.]
MKKTAPMLLIGSLFATGCATASHQQQETISLKTIQEVESKISKIEQEKKQLLQFKKLEGYFLKNNVKLLKEINFFTANSVDKFNKLLGVTKTMVNKVTVPDFDKKIAVIIAPKPSQYLNNISISQIYMIDNNIYVEYKIERDRTKDLGYFALNIAVFEAIIPKVIANICFIDVDNEENMAVMLLGIIN